MGPLSTAAVMLVKDEADVVEATVRHLAWHVDEVVVADNMSTDGTFEILRALVEEGLPLGVRIDREPGHYQGRKTTALALEALGRGHRWVVPCDADELWYAPEGRRIADWLDGLPREHVFAKAAIYNHVCTALDPPATVRESLERHGWAYPRLAGTWGPPAGHDRVLEECPFRRIGWRQRQPLDVRWGKVACRLRPDLEIGEGNHSAATHGTGSTALGLELRHFQFRSADHFVAKAVRGIAAFRAAPDIPEGTGAHWRAYGRHVEEGGPEAGAAWFREHFFSADPEADGSLVHDPAPLRR